MELSQERLEVISRHIREKLPGWMHEVSGDRELLILERMVRIEEMHTSVTRFFTMISTWEFR
jgi:hypothetical protein